MDIIWHSPFHQSPGLNASSIEKCWPNIVWTQVFNAILKKSIRLAKIRYYHATFVKYKHDIKNNWRTISDILCKSSKKNSSIKEISLDGNLIKDYKLIADNFNEFFVNIGPNLANKKPYSSYLNKIITSSFHFEKMAKIVPLHKKEDTLSMDNYRPVSLLSSISKLFEKVVHLQMSGYFKTHKLIYSSRYWFRED